MSCQIKLNKTFFFTKIDPLLEVYKFNEQIHMLKLFFPPKLVPIKFTFDQ